MIYKLLTMIMLITCCLPAFSQDTAYVKSSELEPNWGLWPAYDPVWGTVYPRPNTIIESFRISPNGRFLAYIGYPYTNEGLNGPKFHFYDLKYNKEIYTTIYSGVLNYPHSHWFLDSINVIYIYVPQINSGDTTYKLLNLNLETLNIDSLLCGSGDDNCFFGTLGPDRKGYVTQTASDTYKRLLIDSSFKVGHPIQESIPNYTDMGVINGHEAPFYPIFPPCDIKYCIAQLYTRDSGGMLIRLGLSTIHNFDYQHNRRDFYYSSIPLPDTSWVTINPANFTLGTTADIYLRFGYTSKKEIARGLPYHKDKNPFDSVMLAARSTWGYYRIDTSGNNLVQLVRCWNGGNIEITCDGTIYYYMINMEDTTASIWKMNKYGKNKQMVFNLKIPVTSIDENNALINNTEFFNIQSFSNGNELKIIINNNNYKKILFSIYDLYGNKIKDFYNNPSDKIITLDNTNFTSGIYFLTYRSSKICGAIKFIIIH